MTDSANEYAACLIAVRRRSQQALATHTKWHGLPGRESQGLLALGGFYARKDKGLEGPWTHGPEAHATYCTRPFVSRINAVSRFTGSSASFVTLNPLLTSTLGTSAMFRPLTPPSS